MLRLYFTDPFTTASEIGQIDPFVTDGSAGPYPVVNKSVTDIASTVQVSSTQYFLYNGGFTKSVNGVTLNSAPINGLQGVIPSLTGLNLTGYDNTNVTALGNVEQVPIYLADIDEVYAYYYSNRPADPGIAISFVNNITSLSSASTSWLQLACANATGSALTYQATGTTLYTDNLKGFSTVATSVTAGVNIVDVVTPAAGYYFIPGDFLWFNPGVAGQEIVRLTSFTTGATSLTLTMGASFNSPHSAGELVFSCAREFWVKQTIPLGITNNQPLNAYNLSLLVQATKVQR